MKPPPRPMLRYHGGKFRLRQWIVSLLPPHRVYTECFGGAASVLLAKARSHTEVLNDLNGDLVNLYRVLQAPRLRRALLRQLILTPYSREEFELSKQSTQDPMESARRLLIRSGMGFATAASGIPTGFRTKTGAGVHPARSWATYPGTLKIVGERLSGVVIENRDALAVIDQHDGFNTVHYVDPPYLLSHRSGRAYQNELSDRDHEILAQLLRGLTGHVVISGYDSCLYRRLYDGWWNKTRSAAGERGATRETVWSNRPIDGFAVVC